MSHEITRKAAAETTRMPEGMFRELAQLQAPRRRFVLFVFHRDGVRTAALVAASPIVVGRDATAELQIPDNSLSRRHARFSLDGDHVVVEDLASTNGTRVRGAPIERATLDVGEEVSLGGIVAFVHELSREKSANSAPFAGVDTHDAFGDALTFELVRARFFSRPLVVVTVMPLERSTAGSLRHVCARMREELRAVDRIALYSADCIEISLPEVDAAAALISANKLLLQRSDEPVLVAGISSFPGSADTVDKLVESSREAARKATAKERVQVASDASTRAWTRAGAVEDTTERDLVVESKDMRLVIDTAQRIARSPIPVLLLGETGTGKEVLARTIHEASPRKDKPMVCVNCAAIPQQLVESTLFGHEKGAFTGAVAQHKGVFEAAEGGTVFLDEIGELPQVVQAALLRVLEIRKVCRVGSTREIEVNVRIIAATHRDLEGMVDSGGFRADLLYRLNTMTLRIPSLRTRRDDIPPLAARFLKQACRVSGVDIRAFDPAAMHLLLNYGWPGNVRELRNAIERAVVIADGDVIRTIDLPERVRAVEEIPDASSPSSDKPSRDATRQLVAVDTSSSDDIEEDLETSEEDLPEGAFRVSMRKYETQLLLAALRAAGGNQTEAAKRLELPRRTFQHKMKLLGIRRLGYSAPSPSRGT